MNTKTIEIEVPETIVFEGETYEVTDEFIYPKTGEVAYCLGRRVAFKCSFDECVQRYLICKKRRWRAEEGAYFVVENDLTIESYVDCHTSTDNRRHHYGNYFKSREDALSARDLIKQVLKEFHERGE